MGVTATFITSAKLPFIDKGLIEILIPLKAGRKAFLHVPEDYTEDELNRIAKFVEALR